MIRKQRHRATSAPYRVVQEAEGRTGTELSTSESRSGALTTGPQFPLLKLSPVAMRKPAQHIRSAHKRRSFQWGQMDTQGQMLS